MTDFNLFKASTVVAAALGLALGLSAVPSDSYACHRGTDHGSQICGGGEDPIQFTAELTFGAFEFGPVVVTPNSRENELRSEVPFTFTWDRLNDGASPWDQVFNDCMLLGDNSVDDFFVGRDDWTIEKAGGVRIILRDIRLIDIDGDHAEVTVQLIGEESDFDDDPFLPSSGVRVFLLTQGRISGRSVSGEPGPRGRCQASGQFFLTSPDTATLEITAEPAP